MKKVISLILSIMMLGTLTVPALAADSQDEALKKVTLAVKNTLGIDDSFTDFSGNLSDEGSFSYWSLNWSKDDVSISVNADPNGKILAYSKTRTMITAVAQATHRSFQRQAAISFRRRQRPL